MRYVVTFALVVLTQAMMASVGSAATYFVDRNHPDASDSNGGTAKGPLATISAAVAKLKPGDSVTVKAGVYRESVKITASGTADKPGRVARNRSDYNLMWYTKAWLNRNESTQKKDYGWNRSSFSRWGKTMGNFTYSVDEWFKIRGFDEHSVQWEPMFVSASLLDYRLHRDSVAIGAGERTKYVTDDYLGRKRPEGRPPSIGALEYFPTTPAATKMPMR